MLYLPDCLHGTLRFLEADQKDLTTRVYNVTAMSFTPDEISTSIRQHVPDFQITYPPPATDDVRQQIADSWPQSLDDSEARKDWNWTHQYDLDAMVVDMLTQLDR